MGTRRQTKQNTQCVGRSRLHWAHEGKQNKTHNVSDDPGYIGHTKANKTKTHNVSDDPGYIGHTKANKTKHTMCRTPLYTNNYYLKI